MATDSSLTPAMRQWRQVKDRHPDKIVLFRMGDFYEMFGEDARDASELLEIALTTREKNKADPMPMCGIPFHALDAYLGRLIKGGRKVVLCDQVEDAAAAKGIVRREVTRVVTPGTVLEEGVLEASRAVFLAAWNPSPRATGLVWADLSSGDVVVWQSSAAEAEDRLKAVAPAEILYPETLGEPPAVNGATLTPLSDRHFQGRDLPDELARRFDLPAGLPGIPSEPEPLGALLAILEYARDQGGRTLKTPCYETPGTFVAMDEATRRNLELTANQEYGERRGTLLDCLDSTRTPMGARLLREWVLSPCSVIEEIERRHGTVAAWLANPPVLADCREALKGYPDLARLVARFGAGLASPRDAGMLLTALNGLPQVVGLAEAIGEPLPALKSALPEAAQWAGLLDRRLEERLPPHTREGGMFARGWHEELDALRDLAENAHGAILEVEARERRETGIGSLKVRYNKVFGYFLEVSKANLDKVPGSYERRQTLVNSERFVTQELRELEGRILSARAEREALENRLWEELLAQIQPVLPALRDAAADIARLDVLAGFAVQARERAYVRPRVVEVPVIELDDSRHPVLERDPRHQPFVPNPAVMDTSTNQILLLTGPNMGGKSTYLRQVALITVMAHVGAFVPARRAVVGLVDRLFCRVGAGDSLLRGLSTFMVEMTETAAILRSATDRSLVILDEVGRGTSTYDGLAIAWAVVEALLGPDGTGCRTLFATHYHELTELGRSLAGVVNLTMGVREYAGTVHFLRTVEPGAADKSYGIHVADLAGVPEPVVARARQILEKLEDRREGVGLGGEVPSDAPRQGSLFQGAGRKPLEDLLQALRSASPERMTPVEALLLLDKLKKKLERIS